MGSGYKRVPGTAVWHLTGTSLQWCMEHIWWCESMCQWELTNVRQRQDIHQVCFLSDSLLLSRSGLKTRSSPRQEINISPSLQSFPSSSHLGIFQHADSASLLSTERNCRYLFSEVMGGTMAGDWFCFVRAKKKKTFTKTSGWRKKKIKEEETQPRPWQMGIVLWHLVRGFSRLLCLQRHPHPDPPPRKLPDDQSMDASINESCSIHTIISQTYTCRTPKATTYRVQAS